MRIDLNLSRLLSFTSLVVGWIGACLIKYYLYNISGFGRHWIEKDPELWEQIKVFFEYGLYNGQVLIILAAALVADKFLWPYFFRDEVHEVNQIT